MSKIFYLFELFITLIQGKGYGSTSIKREVKSIKKFIKSNPNLILDIGGNKGIYTEELIKYFPNTEIHIFEPSATNVSILHKKFKNKNITIVPNGVLDKISKVFLYADEIGSGLGSLTKRRLDHYGIDFSTHEEINTIRIEDYWRDILACREIDFVKLDIEGHELSALYGFGEAINVTKVIQFEFGGANIDTKTFFQDFWYFFKKLDFEIHRITPFGTQKLISYKELDEFFGTTNYIAVKK